MLAAVHYGELSDSPGQEVVDELLRSGLAGEFIEIVKQPAIVHSVDIPVLMRWRRDQVRLERQWRKYLGRPSYARSLAAVINQRLYEARLKWNGNFREMQWISRQIEQFVTAKHISAWQLFMSSDHSALIVMEADATLRQDSIVRLTEAVAGLDSAAATYVNLAGGLDSADLSIAHLVTTESNGLRSFSQPVTNTSCAYAMNQPLVSDLLAFLSDVPESGNLGIDWLLNSFFIRQIAAGKPVRCAHAHPPALQHGSLVGLTRSWHPDR